MKIRAEKAKKKQAIKFFLSGLILTLLFISTSIFIYGPTNTAHATINDEINFQGKLTNPNGTNVTDGSYSVVFSLYTLSSGGSNVWTESDTVTTSSGIFNVNLGAVTALPGSVNFDSASLYLGIKVGTDPEMTPRIQFTAVPQAFQANNADNLGGVAAASYAQLGTNQIFTGTNTFQPTTNISSLKILQNSSGSFSQDVFDVQGSSGGTNNFIQVTSTAANQGAVTIASLGSNNLNLNSGSNTISVGATTIQGTAALTLSSGGTSNLTIDTASSSATLNLGTVHAGTIALGASNLFVADVTDARIGIGTAPSGAGPKLTIVGPDTSTSTLAFSASGSSGTGLTVSDAGHVGIGVNPGTGVVLYVNENVGTNSNSYGEYNNITGTSSGSSDIAAGRFSSLNLTTTGSGGTVAADYINTTATLSNTNAYAVGEQQNLTVNAYSDNTSAAQAVGGSTYIQGSNQFFDAAGGGFGVYDNTTSGTALPLGLGVSGTVDDINSDNITLAEGTTGLIAIQGSGNIVTGRVLYASSPRASSSGTIGTEYGLYVDTQKNAAVSGTAYGIYQAGTSDLNVLSGATSFANSVTIQGGTALTLGTNNSQTGGIIFEGSGGTGTLTVVGPTTPNTGNYTLTIPTITSNDTLCTVNTGCGGGSGVTTVAAFSGTSEVNGANITGANITFGPADTTNPGMVSTGAQTFGGAKTIQASSTSAFVVQNASGGAVLTANTTAGGISVGQGYLLVSGLGTPTLSSVTAGSNQGGTLSGSSGTTYYYKVSAIVSSNETLPSSELSINGSSFTPLTPPGAPTVAIAAGAGLTNASNYEYQITFVTANGETIGGTTSAQVTTSTGNDRVNLTAIPLGPTGTTARKIYRTKAGDVTPFKLVTTLNNNTATTDTDSTADASLGASAPASNTATTNLNNATITFTTVPGATSYRIYRGTSSGGENFYQTNTTSPFTDTGATGTSGTPATTDATARLGIGTTSPTTSLEVVGTSLFQSPANITTALQIQNATASNVLQASTVSQTDAQGGTDTGAIGINGASVSGGYALNVSGSINSSTALYVNGTAICTVSGCTSVASNSFVKNSVLTQTSTNFDIQSGNVGYVGGIIQGYYGQTADLLDLDTYNAGSILFSVSASGSILSHGSANSTTAFQVQNTGGNAVLTANTTNQSVTIGSASSGNDLATTSTLTGLNGPYAVATGDFNGDGHTDLAVANLNTGTVSIFINTGTGLPTTASYTLTGLNSPYGLVTGDFNGDGYTDLAVANEGSGGSVSIFTNSGTALPTTASYTLTGVSSPTALVTGDFNGDGHTDLAVANTSSTTVSIFTNSGSALPTSPSYTLTGLTTPAALITADFNGDTKTDLAVANDGSNTVSIFTNSGTALPTTASYTLTGLSNPYSLATGDFNGDTKTDLAVADEGTNSVSIFINNGTSFTTTDGTAPNYDLSGLTSQPQNLVSGDFNGDGKTDLAVADYNSIYVPIFINNGTSFTTAAGTSPNYNLTGLSYPAGLAAADFNGDSYTDLAVANSGGNTVTIFDSNTTPVRLNVISGSAATVGTVIQGASSQTADLLEIQNSSSLVLDQIKSNGQICIGGNSCTFGHASEVLGVVGTAWGTSFNSGTPDVAEYIDASPGTAAYDIVVADPNNTEAVTTTSTPYNSGVIGVIANGTSGFEMTNAHYGQAFNPLTDQLDPNALPMTITGRVPVNVTCEGGSISPGDYITTSATPGYGMKADQAGPSVGKALGYLSCDSTTDQGTVLVLVSLTYYPGPDASSYVQNGGNATLTGLTVGGTSDFEDLNSSGTATINNLTVTGSATIATLEVTGSAQFDEDITISGHIITAGNTPTIQVQPAAGAPSQNDPGDQQATATISGNDTSGTITITTSDNPSSGELSSIAFSKAYTSTPRILISGQDGPSAASFIYPADKTDNGFNLNVDNPPKANTTYTFDYFILQ